jgi:hypothetical protein
LHADDSWFKAISRSYADTVHNHSVPGYMTFLNGGITNGYQWYMINGGRQDFVTYELHGREVTIELADGFIVPSDQLEPLWQANWRSFLGYLENALYGIHGQVKDERTSIPVAAKVFIAGHDRDSSHVYSDTIAGSFTRLLSPGLWDLTFSANGYRDTTIYDVPVTSYQRTDVLIEMKSTGIPVVTEPLLFPNPVTNEFKAVLPELLNGRINIKIINNIGMLVSDFDEPYTAGSYLVINTSNLAGGVYTIVFTSTHSGVSLKARFIVTGRYF